MGICGFCVFPMRNDEKKKKTHAIILLPSTSLILLYTTYTLLITNPHTLPILSLLPTFYISYYIPTLILPSLIIYQPSIYLIIPPLCLYTNMLIYPIYTLIPLSPIYTLLLLLKTIIIYS